MKIYKLTIGWSILITAIMCAAMSVASASACMTNAVVIIAHPDDALVFMKDNVLYQRTSGNCVHIVSLTSYYDDGKIFSGREEGARAAYQLVPDQHAPDDTIQHAMNFNTGLVEKYGTFPYYTYQIHNNKNLTLSFLRMPASTYPGYTPGSVYSHKDDPLLIASLQAFIEAYQPDRVYTLNTQGLLSGINDCVVQHNGMLSTNECDHYDHVGTAILARAAFLASNIHATLFEFHAYDMARGKAVNTEIAPNDPACLNFCATRDAYISHDTAALGTPWGAFLSTPDMYTATKVLTH